MVSERAIGGAALLAVIPLFLAGCPGEAPVAPEGVESNAPDPAELAGTWKGIQITTATGACTLSGSRVDTSSVVFDCWVNESGEIWWRQSEPAAYSTWNGTIASNYYIQIRRTFDVECGGQLRRRNGTYEGTIRKEEGSYRLDMSADEVWCPEYNCTFHVSFSVARD